MDVAEEHENDYLRFLRGMRPEDDDIQSSLREQLRDVSSWMAWHCAVDRLC